MIELARAQAMPRPWGVLDLKPWSQRKSDGVSVGEIWYERTCSTSPTPSLLLKLLFASQPLSIQVHPDDAYARSIGQPNGKTEAWYVLNAASGAKVAVGLKEHTTAPNLRTAIDNGSISELVDWKPVSVDDVIFVPAGTIHAIGAGLIVAEIQQRSDATFRLFDHGRQRDLHIESGMAVALMGPADFQPQPNKLSRERTQLLSNPYFVFERIELAPGTKWCLDAERETWMLVIDGSATADAFEVATGDAIFAQSDRLTIEAGLNGVVGLVAYSGGDGPVPHLLQRLAQPISKDARQQNQTQMPTSLTRTQATPTNGRGGTFQ